jgi:hypothetical protein
MPVWPKAAVESTHAWYGKMVTAANNSRTESDHRTPLKQNPYFTIGAGVC